MAERLYNSSVSPVYTILYQKQIAVISHDDHCPYSNDGDEVHAVSTIRTSYCNEQWCGVCLISILYNILYH